MNADKFRALRLYKDLTQSEFADLLGVSLATVARIETGSLEVTPRVRAKLARIDIEEESFLSFYERFIRG